MPECTFIDPDTTRVDALLRDSDRGRICATSIQDVPVDEFRRLQAGDIFFADSSHVAKVGSDVNHIFFRIFLLS